jgi:chorismate mutase
MEVKMVRAIRGAITVDNNTAEEIIKDTKTLLTEIEKANNLVLDDVISIIFSSTKDLDAAFPAVAARELGWTEIALMCTNEVYVPDSLKMCIRILIHINTEKGNKELKHMYLKGAKILRPDLQE